MLIDEEAEIVTGLSLPLAWAALHLTEFDSAEALVIAVIPLEHILHACCLLAIAHLFPAKVRLEFG